MSNLKLPSPFKNKLLANKIFQKDKEVSLFSLPKIAAYSKNAYSSLQLDIRIRRSSHPKSQKFNPKTIDYLLPVRLKRNSAKQQASIGDKITLAINQQNRNQCKLPGPGSYEIGKNNQKPSRASYFPLQKRFKEPGKEDRKTRQSVKLHLGCRQILLIHEWQSKKRKSEKRVAFGSQSLRFYPLASKKKRSVSLFSAISKQFIKRSPSVKRPKLRGQKLGSFLSNWLNCR